jgi:2-polyprenyl-6-methoxyphenol hydroxylase-like FAD-dependent oxidoreductase
MSSATAKASLLVDKSVAIVGAGPSGLTLARLLQMRGATVHVFESDSSSAARDQGGSLDLHEDSGQIAVRKAGLEDRFLAMSRAEAQTSRVFDKHGVIHLDLRPQDEKATRPEIERGELRGLLLGSLAPSTVEWERRLRKVERTRDDRHLLTFENGPPVTADLLFGCDGTWSKVRPLVTREEPRYAGLTFVESRLSSPDTRHPKVAEMVGPGTIMVTSDNKALMAQRNADGNIRIYVTLRVAEDWAERYGLDFGEPANAREGLLKYFEGWAPHVREMLTGCDDYFIPRPLYTLPPEQTWQARPDVTLLGDAAHVMPPFTGKGANYAMLDAVELADNLTSGRFSDIASALRAYETIMLRRMSKAIAETLADQDVLIAPRAPEGIVALFRRRIRQQTADANERTST